MRAARVIRWKGLLGSGLGCLLAVFLAGSAHATGYTVQATATFSQAIPVSQGGGTVSGSILAVTSPGTCIVLDGTCDLSGDYVGFVLQMDAGSIAADSVSVSVLANPSKSALGAGYSTGTGTPPSSGSIATASAPLWSFSGGLGGGATSDPLYAAYALGDLSTTGGFPFPSNTLSFSIEPSGAGQAFSFQTTMAMVPEPATGALLLLGASGLALLRRRRG